MFILIQQLVELFKETVSLLRQILSVLRALLHIALLLARKGQSAGIHPPETLAEDPLHDAVYAADRIGVSDKTLGRQIKKGLLTVADRKNRKRLFRKSDIEKCRRFYRGE